MKHIFITIVIFIVLVFSISLLLNISLKNTKISNKELIINYASQYGDREDNQVTYLAKVKKISTSGDAQFWWYDNTSKTIVDPNNQYAWFFALPSDVPKDSEATDKWVKFIQDNQDSVFKITGTRGNDDCEYWGQDHCIENINIKSIELL